MFGFKSQMIGSNSRMSFWENTAVEENKEDKELEENRFSVTQRKMCKLVPPGLQVEKAKKYIVM